MKEAEANQLQGGTTGQIRRSAISSLTKEQEGMGTILQMKIHVLMNVVASECQVRPSKVRSMSFLSHNGSVSFMLNPA